MRRTVLVAAFALLLVNCGGAEQATRADTDHPTTYAKDGLTFQVPGNWSVTEDEDFPTHRFVLVEEPGNALVVMQLFPFHQPADIAALARDFAASTAIASKPWPQESTFGTPGTAGGYETLREAFTLRVLASTVPHTRDYRLKAYGDRMCFIVAQVADEDRANVKSGFEQIARSMDYREP